MNQRKAANINRCHKSTRHECYKPPCNRLLWNCKNFLWEGLLPGIDSLP